MPADTIKILRKGKCNGTTPVGMIPLYVVNMADQMQDIMQALKYITANMVTKAELTETKLSLKKELEQSESRMRVYIENTVTSKIDALFDGYKGALESQALLSAENKILIKAINDLPDRVAILESKIA